MIRRVVLAGVTALAFATPARADIQFLNQCTPGAVGMCMSFWLALEYDPTPFIGPFPPVITEGSTWFTLRIANHEAFGTDAPAMIRSMKTLGLETNWTSGLDHAHWRGNTAFASDKPVYYRTNLFGERNLSEWGYLPDWETYAITQRHLGYEDGQNLIHNYGTDTNGIFGCSTPAKKSSVLHACEAEITLRFQVPGLWWITDQTRIEWEGYVYPNPDNNGAARVSCTTGVDCVSVPEPTSLLLLASGLLGIAWTRRRRAA